jgi:hypothetical protein
VLVATVRGARGSRVRLLHGLTGTKADRRRRARTRFSSVQGGPVGHERLLLKRLFAMKRGEVPVTAQ